MRVLNGVGACLRGELFRARRRADVIFVLGGLLVIELLLYLGGYATARGDHGPGTARDILSLHPAGVVGVVSSLAPLAGGVAAAIAAGIVASGEYGPNTLKVLLTQGPGRLTLFAAKILAVAVLVAAYVFAAYLIGLLAGAVILLADGGSRDLPPLDDLARGFGVDWVVMVVWAFLGFCLASLLRNTGLGIGIAVAYLVLGDTIINFALHGWGQSWKPAETVAGNMLGERLGQFASVLDPHAPAVDWGRVSLAVGTYVLVFLGSAALVFRRRDVA